MPGVPHIKLTRLVVLGGCVVAGLFVGCSSGSDPDSAIASVNKTNIQRLANLYLTYQSLHEWHGPADEAQFKTFLHGFNAHMLSRIGVDPNALDQLFVSERDGQPFKIRYGVQGSSMGSSAPVIFESVATARGGWLVSSTCNSVKSTNPNITRCGRRKCCPRRSEEIGSAARSILAPPRGILTTMLETRHWKRVQL